MPTSNGRGRPCAGIKSEAPPQKVVASYQTIFTEPAVAFCFASLRFWRRRVIHELALV